MSWKNDLLAKLAQRDKSMETQKDVFLSFQFLSTRIASLERQLDTVQRDDSKKTVLDLLGEIDQLKQKLDLTEDSLKHEIAKNKELVKELSTIKNNFNILTDGYKKLQERHLRLQEESKIKFQNLESLNDDILSLNIENNLLNDRMAKLKQENESLIERWMKRVKQEAEVLNDANEALSRSEKSLKPES
ncbi:Autophagy-related protein 16 [Ogataea parapolymorpha DL-1]|uniref:Autophagy-related protein 16 n=1 Tax=Ogataea parapolymorpha (strain ATCC 26012 / BCRC 20466 / JCM 22074 / NRRL Y-7560 / DL-1) TaxID=871575 RepID=W1QDP6_OGAPD|nr:Autophagy-related protein 16 [Ogataea parapolymorpha DL-1]ESW98669.1 Autophagy-related protein 16 [Ogataea parapolymorpha DL-1]